MYHTNNTHLPASNYNNVSLPESNIYEYLTQERQINHHSSWNKLDMTTKKQKLVSYARSFGEENHLSKEKIQDLIEFFQECLEKKKLNLVKEVIYDKNQGTIVRVPGLTFNKTKQKYTLTLPLITSTMTKKNTSLSVHNKTLKTNKKNVATLVHADSDISDISDEYDKNTESL